jgi:hypothetical protein
MEVASAALTFVNAGWETVKLIDTLILDYKKGPRLVKSLRKQWKTIQEVLNWLDDASDENGYPARLREFVREWREDFENNLERFLADLEKYDASRFRICWRKNVLEDMRRDIAEQMTLLQQVTFPLHLQVGHLLGLF